MPLVCYVTFVCLQVTSRLPTSLLIQHFVPRLRALPKGLKHCSSRITGLGTCVLFAHDCSLNCWAPISFFFNRYRISACLRKRRWAHAGIFAFAILDSNAQRISFLGQADDSLLRGIMPFFFCRTPCWMSPELLAGDFPSQANVFIQNFKLHWYFYRLGQTSAWSHHQLYGQLVIDLSCSWSSLVPLDHYLSIK